MELEDLEDLEVDPAMEAAVTEALVPAMAIVVATVADMAATEEIAEDMAAETAEDMAAAAETAVVTATAEAVDMEVIAQTEAAAVVAVAAVKKAEDPMAAEAPTGTIAATSAVIGHTKKSGETSKREMSEVVLLRGNMGQPRSSWMFICLSKERIKGSTSTKEKHCRTGNFCCFFVFLFYFTFYSRPSACKEIQNVVFQDV